MPELRFRYQTLEFGTTDIHLRTLRDNQEFSDDDGIAERLGISSASWPLFGVLWPSGKILAQQMLGFDIANKRILEVGCGLGLASHLLNHRKANITATDYHPNAEEFMRENTKLNQSAAIPFVRTGWGDEKSSLGEFDVIIGSDILYEHEHASLLAHFLQQHAAAHCEIMLVDPGRGHHAKFSKRMQAFGFTHTQTKPEIETGSLAFRGQVLFFLR